MRLQFVTIGQNLRWPRGRLSLARKKNTKGIDDSRFSSSKKQSMCVTISTKSMSIHSIKVWVPSSNFCSSFNSTYTVHTIVFVTVPLNKQKKTVQVKDLIKLNLKLHIKFAMSLPYF